MMGRKDVRKAATSAKTSHIERAYAASGAERTPLDLRCFDLFAFVLALLRGHSTQQLMTPISCVNA